MKCMILAAPLAMLLGSTALAQTAETTTAPAEVDATTYGTEWSGAIMDALYADADTKTLRSQDEIAQSWAGLTQEERDQVSAECGRLAQDNNASGATGLDTSAVDGTDPAMTEGMATDGAAAEGEMATDDTTAPDAGAEGAATGDMAANGTVDQGTDGTIDETAPVTGDTATDDMATDDTATDTTDTTDMADMAEAPAGDAQTGMATDGAVTAGVQNVDMIALCPLVEGL